MANIDGRKSIQAAQRAHELRDEVCEAISEIPKRLGHIHRQLHVHYKSPNLRACADAILVSIFVLLERIVGELTKSLTSKRTHGPSVPIAVTALYLTHSAGKVFMATIKGSEYADDIKDAIKTLSTRVDEFDSEARICDSERLGQVKENGVRTMIAIESIEELLRQTKQEKEALYERIRFLESQAVKDNQDTQNVTSGLRQSLAQEELQTSVYNEFYRLFMAHPNVDTRTGKRE